MHLRRADVLVLPGVSLCVAQTRPPFADPNAWARCDSIRGTARSSPGTEFGVALNGRW